MKPYQNLPRAVALTALNGDLSDEVLIPFLDGLVRSGYEAICAYPRDGLTVPYPSKAYWERFDRLIVLARERGLGFWFYDEFYYQPGSAGGQIPQLHPAARLRALRFDEVRIAPDSRGRISLGAEPLLALLRLHCDEQGRVLRVSDVTDEAGMVTEHWAWAAWHNRFYYGTTHVREELHERGLCQSAQWMYQPSDEINTDRLLAVHLVTVAGGRGLLGVPDISLPEVTDLFLDTIYSQFAHLAQKHGLDDALVFQDEVTFYEAEWPWNREIERRLSTLWGDQLLSNLAALDTTEVPYWETLRNDYRSACQLALEEGWFARVSRYCHQHDLRVTGHLPGEESIAGHRRLFGDSFKALHHFDVPGFDIISSAIADDVNRGAALGPKLVQSAAWIDGRKATMAEVFGANGFHSDLQKSRTVLGWLGAHDIRSFADHGTWLSSKSIRKYDAPPVNTRFDPLDRGRPNLWEWQRWFGERLEEYLFDPETLVLFPVESFSRYQMSKPEEWKPETSLLETFFHYLCAYTLDSVFLPSDRLSEVAVVPEGFEFKGHRFKSFVVPPVFSLHNNTYDLLQRICDQPGFCWFHLAPAKTITLFGGCNLQDRQQPISAHGVLSCTEEELVDKGVAWFDDVLSSRLKAIQTDTSIVRSLRKNIDSGDQLLLLINPLETAMTVKSTHAFGHALRQPPNGVTSEATPCDGGWQVTLAPRDVALFAQEIAAGDDSMPDEDTSTLEKSLEHKKSLENRPVRVTVRRVGANHVSLKVGRAYLQEHDEIAFMPGPISKVWPLEGVRQTVGPDEFLGPLSLEPLPQSLSWSVRFPVILRDRLDDLMVVIDEESLPPDVRVRWDDEVLPMAEVDLYDQGNTIFPVPAELLNGGEHELKFDCRVSHAMQGLLEHPVLVGSFLVDRQEPLCLSRTPQEPILCSAARTWTEMGIPEGYGPVEYEAVFILEEDVKSFDWEIALPTCTGVAEVKMNDQPVGRSSWEPRVLPIDKGLCRGENQVSITLYGSWNNIFSQLNPVANGLCGDLLLRRRPRLLPEGDGTM